MEPTDKQMDAKLTPTTKTVAIPTTTAEATTSTTNLGTPTSTTTATKRTTKRSRPTPAKKPNMSLKDRLYNPHPSRSKYNIPIEAFGNLPNPIQVAPIQTPAYTSAQADVKPVVPKTGQGPYAFNVDEINQILKNAKLNLQQEPAKDTTLINNLIHTKPWENLKLNNNSNLINKTYPKSTKVVIKPNNKEKENYEIDKVNYQILIANKEVKEHNSLIKRRFQEQLEKDQQSVLEPSLTKFKDFKDCFNRLVPFHIFQNVIHEEHDLLIQDRVDKSYFNIQSKLAGLHRRLNQAQTKSTSRRFLEEDTTKTLIDKLALGQF